MLQKKQVLRLFAHLSYWLLSTVFLTYFFGHFDNAENTSPFVLLQLPIIIATTYAINYWLVPIFLFRKKIALFFFLLAGTVIVSIWMNALLTVFVLVNIYEFDASKMPESQFDFSLLTTGLYLVVLVGVSIHFVKEAFKQQNEKHKFKQQQAETSLLLQQSQLKLLQNQLHPHMLFNSLNTIYGLSLQKSDKTADLILKLSNLLDYMLYRCNDERIFLKTEIEMLKNYISLERQKFGDALSLECLWPEKSESALIAPLILLPLIENTLKHTRNSGIERPAIKIWAQIENEKLICRTENTYNKLYQPKKPHGIGLKNLRKRLELHYPENHSLNIIIEDNMYKCCLEITLDNIENNEH